MKLDDAIQKRRSVRKFYDKKVKWGHILEAIDAANQAPFAGNINNLQYIIVSDQNKKNDIAVCCQQDWIADAQFVIIICADYKYLNKLYGDQGEIYGKQQVGAAIQNFLLKITDLKLSSCWVGAYTPDHLRDSFSIPENLVIEALLPVGYKHPTAKINKPRKNSLERCIHWDKFGIRKKPTFFKEK